MSGSPEMSFGGPPEMASDLDALLFDYERGPNAHVPEALRGELEYEPELVADDDFVDGYPEPI